MVKIIPWRILYSDLKAEDDRNKENNMMNRIEIESRLAEIEAEEKEMAEHQYRYGYMIDRPYSAKLFSEKIQLMNQLKHNQGSETMKKTIILGEEELTLTMDTYFNNENMYIGLDCMDDGYPEPFCDLTVNLDETLPPYMAYVDTNNLPQAEALIRVAGLGEPTGQMKASGFCMYPLYSFNKERLQEYCPDGVLNYEASLSAPAKRKGR